MDSSLFVSQVYKKNMKNYAVLKYWESIDDLRDRIKCILERERIDARSGAA